MKRKDSVIVLFLVEISLLLIVSIVLLLHAPSTEYFDNKIPKNPLISRINLNINKAQTPLKKIISNAVNSSLYQYIDTCLNSDFLRPVSNTCLNTSGLSITLISSLDTVYIMDNKKLYNKMRDYVVNDFTCKVNRLINTHDLMTHVIGGLISIYSLTHDDIYLNKIEECTEVALKAFSKPVPMPLVHGTKNIAKNYNFIDGTYLSESSGFIVEMEALSHILNDNKYNEYVNSYLKELNSLCRRDNGYKQFLTQGSQKGKDRFVGHTALFYANVMRSYMLSESYEKKFVIDFFDKMFSKKSVKQIFGYDGSKKSLFETQSCQVFPLLRKMNRTYTSAFKRIEMKCIEMESEFLPITEVSSNTLFDDQIDTKFNFESSLLEDVLYTNKEMEKLDFAGSIEDCLYNNIFCSLSKQNPSEFNDFMPAEAVSKWAKYLYMGKTPIDLQKYIFNEAGHFIPKEP